MLFTADLHIHSKYSRATSNDMVPEGLWKWAQLKGIDLVGTGDFTHPAWLGELTEKLEPLGNGLMRLKKRYQINGIPHLCEAPVSFILSSEISCIYRKNGRTRKVHAIIFVPDISHIARINLALSRIGNLSSDGRPILGLDAKELLRIVKDVSPDALFVPAHVWTPHFSVFGAASGFDSLEECFEELTPEIQAIETGLSSDPSMNWKISALDNITFISNSDAHSPGKMGREANIFEGEVSYATVARAIRTKKGFFGTIEFFPEEGKYHHDGHRSCGVNLSPEETIRHGYLCPRCGKRVTVGVMHRINSLADRRDGFRPHDALPFHSTISLKEILAEILGVGVASKSVNLEYLKLLHNLGSELAILMETSLDDIEQGGSRPLREAIERVREGRIHITPGYDGKYGKIRIFEEHHGTSPS